MLYLGFSGGLLCYSINNVHISFGNNDAKAKKSIYVIDFQSHKNRMENKFTRESVELCNTQI